MSEEISDSRASTSVEIHPLTPGRWDDLVALFGERGACGGCWCMWWRLPKREFEAQRAVERGAPNRVALRRLVDEGAPTGLLAYLDGQPVGWCAVAPREQLPRLGNSRTLRGPDEDGVWSVPCLFVARPYRRRGVSVALLRAAAAFAAAHGARVTEGYPVEARTARMPDTFAWTGLASAFAAAGYREVMRRSPSRPIMRRDAGPRPAPEPD
jgi:GNAT superfamily N-acetyltransferase